MNTKEKDELRESLQFPAGTIGKSVLLHHTEAEYLLKAIDHMEGNCSGCENHFKDSNDCPICKVYEHHQPLDAGELEEKFAAVTNYIRVEVETGLREAEDYGLSDSAIEQCAKIAQSFAQASITAKQKEQHIIHEELISGMGEKTLKMFDDGVDENVIDGYQMALNEVVKYLL